MDTQIEHHLKQLAIRIQDAKAAQSVGNIENLVDAVNDCNYHSNALARLLSCDD